MTPSNHYRIGVDGGGTKTELILVDAHGLGTVGKTGKGIGKFRAEVADVHGQIHDTLVTGSLVVRSSGRISGVVYYREVEIEKSGQIEGKMAQGDAPASITEEAPAQPKEVATARDAAPAKDPAPVAKDAPSGTSKAGGA